MQLHHHGDIFQSNVHKQIAWDVTWKLIRSYAHFNCLSWKKSNRHIFITKLLTKSLPLSRLCKQRQRELYRELTCPGCENVTMEDWGHMFSCPALKDRWDKAWVNIRQRWKTHLDKKRKHGTKSPNNTSSNRDVFTDNQWNFKINHFIMQSLGTSASAIQFDAFIKWAMEVKVFYCEVDRLKSTLQIGTEEATDLWALLLDTVIDEFYEIVWKYRCELMIDWERQHNITPDAKRNYSTRISLEYQQPETTDSQELSLTRKDREILALPHIWKQVRNMI